MGHAELISPGHEYAFKVELLWLTPDEAEGVF